MRLQWVPSELICGRCLGQGILNSKLLKWHQYRVSETHDVMLTSCYHWVWLWLPRRVSLLTEVYQLGHVKTTIFLKSPVLLLFIDYRQKCVEDASGSSPAWSQLCDNPYGNRWQRFGLAMPNGEVLSLYYATVWTLWPFFLTGILRDPRNPRLCHFLRKWCLLRTSTRSWESIKMCVGAQAVVIDTLNSKLVASSSDRGQGRFRDKPYPDFKSKVSVRLQTLRQDGFF